MSTDIPFLPTVAFEAGSEVEINASTAMLSTDANATTQVCNNAYCVSDDDYLSMIFDYVFPTPFEWTLVALYAVVFVVGLTGNALVVYVVWRNAHMRTVTNLFIVNLSVADLMVIAICLPATALIDITETWYLGLAMCKIAHYVQVGVLLHNHTSSGQRP